MAPSGLDYSEEHTYEIEQIEDSARRKDTIGILHRIRGNNLVSRLLRKNQANFACTLVSPWCAYRNVERATGTPERSSKGLQLEQIIEIDKDQFSHPIMFQPSVITNTHLNKFKGKESHGLDGLWVGEEISFPIAAVIAVQSFWNTKTTMQSILRLRKVSDSSLKPGSFEVQDVTEEGFYFLVDVDEDLYKSLRYPVSFEHRNSIYSMALSQGLEILHQRYKDRETWMDQQNLKLLYQMLKDKNLPTWEDDEFRANQAAAAFHPHKVKMAQEQEID